MTALGSLAKLRSIECGDVAGRWLIGKSIGGSVVALS